ncbi:hypothetical protein ACKFKF_15625 [Phormidesmis sp. 146-12]
MCLSSYGSVQATVGVTLHALRNAGNAKSCSSRTGKTSGLPSELLTSYKSPGYGDGTGYGATEATDQQQTSYAPLDTWTSGYQENVYDRANLLDTSYLDTAANPNPDAGAFAPYQTSTNPYSFTNQGYIPPQPLPKPKPHNKTQSSPNHDLYRSSTFELEL